MDRAMSSLAIAATLAVLAAPLAAQPTASTGPVTLGEWIACDQAMGRLEPSPARSAALDALQREVVAALRAARAALEAQTPAAGERPGPTCLPPPGSVELTSDEIGSWVYTRPVSEYGDALDQVMLRFLAFRFACR